MKLRSLKNNNYGVLSFFLVFIFMASMLVFLFAVGIPFSIAFTTEMYTASEDIIAGAQDQIEEIQDVEVRDRLDSTLDDALASTEDTITILSFFYQYSWVWIMLIIVFIIFIGARKVVETNQMGVI